MLSAASNQAFGERESKTKKNASPEVLHLGESADNRKNP
jgi:hypothetical protein